MRSDGGGTLHSHRTLNAGDSVITVPIGHKNDTINQSLIKVKPSFKS